MANLFDGIGATDDIREIFTKMEENCPKPSSTSKSLWKLRRKVEISDHNTRPETILEKAVVLLAENGYMPGWYNQCPTASGIGDSRRNRHKNVDLARWSDSRCRARLVKLKVASDDPPSALRQILEYGAAYVFCRTYQNKLPFYESLKDASHVSLEVVAPRRFYEGWSEADRIDRVRGHLAEFTRSQIPELSMSLNAFTFPDWFEPRLFENGRDVKEQCGTPILTGVGKKVRDAFDRLEPVWVAS